MPKWLLALMTAVVAGILGFVFGALLPESSSKTKKSETNVDSSSSHLLTKPSDMVQNSQNVLNQQSLTQTQKPKPNKDEFPPIFAKTKPQVISFPESLGYSIGSESYMNQKGLTVFPLEDEARGKASIRITWRKPDYEYVKDILLSNTHVDPSPKGARPVLAAWVKIQPDLIFSFQDIQNITPPESLSSKLRWYQNGPYAYGICQNNKYFIQYIGPQSRIPILQKQYLECTILYISWYNGLEKTRASLEKMNKPGTSLDQFFEACINTTARHNCF